MIDCSKTSSHNKSFEKVLTIGMRKITDKKPICLFRK